MDQTLLLLLAVLAPVLTGLATLFLPVKAVTPRVMLALAGQAFAFAVVLNHMLGGVPWAADPSAAMAAIPWMPSLNIEIAFLVDGLGGFFALLVAGIGCMIVLYARGYFGGHTDHARADLRRFYPTLGFFTTAMLGVVTADFMLLTLLFWEMTSISSFLLIGWDRYDKKAVRLAMQAFFTTGLGGMGLLGGVLLLGEHTGIWRWTTLYQQGVEVDAQVMWAFGLMFIGAATKSAQWPWHYWLPGAMAAPTPVSAYLHSATMVKAGVFLVGRLFPVFGLAIPGDSDGSIPLWAGIIIPFGAVTMLYAAITAIKQHDLKRIFAYTTVSQLGLLMTMYGLGALTYTHDGHTLPAIDLDITQIANHAFYKAPLFIIAGALGHVASRDITRLHGAWKDHKAMVITMLMAGYALAALPGSISFQAKELFLYAIYHAKDALGSWWLVLMAATILTATCNVAIFIRLAATLLGLPGSMKDAPGAEPDHHHDHHEHEHGFWASMIWIPGLVIVSWQYLGGIAPEVFWNPVFHHLEIGHYFDHGVPDLLYVLSHPGIPLYCSLLAIVLGVGLGFSPVLRRPFVDIHDAIYPQILYRGAVGGGGRLFRVVQTGHLKHYVLMVLGALVIGFVAAAALEPGFMLGPIGVSAGRAFEMLPAVALAVLVCGSAIALPMARSRVVRVLLLGACGFSVVGLYLAFQAPDLALTQLMVEIISVILFVLVLRMLPEPTPSKEPGRVWRAGVGVVIGVVFAWMTVVAATSAGDRDPAWGISAGTFAAERSYAGDELTGGRGGGGNNVVNVILVDFRGFDTFGEICVLGLAALGVWSLMPGRRTRKDPPVYFSDVPGDGLSMPQGGGPVSGDHVERHEHENERERVAGGTL